MLFLPFYVTRNGSKSGCSVSMCDGSVETGAMYILDVLHILDARSNMDLFH